jgi:2-polyprenyl-3-methyl-5-hydroxy-6-metoxy-1,4-benzoquinol methylase
MQENAGYLTQTYWSVPPPLLPPWALYALSHIHRSLMLPILCRDDRYTREDPASEGYDWFKSYSDPELSRLLNLHIPLKSSRIIMLGCGNSTLGPEMHADGFERIVNVDYSPVCIKMMKHMHEGKEGMDWVVGDIMDLQFEEGSFDVAIDKVGTCS